MRRTWIALGTLAPVALAAALFAKRQGPPADLPEDVVAISHVARVASEPKPAPALPPLAGLNLAKLRIEQDGVFAPAAEKRVARLTLDPELQRTAERIMASYHLPEAAVVMMDTATGHVLVYASHVDKGPSRDLCVEATAPAASVFKIVTSSALVQDAGLSPNHKECYSGGASRILARDLEADPARDRSCTTLKGALGHSTNTVFARLALSRLAPKVLSAMASHFQFNAPLPFDVPVEQSTLRLPDDSLGYARTAAGFWNSTLSPLHAAWISATVARRGVSVRPTIVSSVSEDGKVIWEGASEPSDKRVIETATARAVQTMMDETVTEGTSYKAFHDRRGTSFVGNVAIAGKTGTLTDAAASRFYTWFTGFSHAPAGEGATDPAPPVAIGVLVVNGPTWTIKANTLAREIFRGYLAKHDVPSVTAPQVRSVADKSSSPPSRSARKHKRRD